MTRVTRKCTQCGALDTHETWDSVDEATKKGAFGRAWACSTCAWTEFDLVDHEVEVAGEATPASQT